MWLGSRRVAAALLIGVVVLWIGTWAVVTTVTLSSGPFAHPLYLLGLITLLGFFNLAVGLGIGHQVLAAIERIAHPTATTAKPETAASTPTDAARAANGHATAGARAPDSVIAFELGREAGRAERGRDLN